MSLNDLLDSQARQCDDEASNDDVVALFQTISQTELPTVLSTVLDWRKTRHEVCMTRTRAS